MNHQENNHSANQTLADSSFAIQEQVNLLYMQAPISNSFIIVTASLYYYLFESYLNSTLPLVWLLSLLLCALFRLYLWYCHKNASESKSPQQWKMLYLIASLLTGISWSLIYPSIHGATHALIFPALMMLGFGVISSAVSALSPYLPAFIAYTFPQALGLSIGLLLFDDPVYHWLVFAVVVYIVMTTLFILNSNRSILQGIKVQESNNGLIKELNNEVSQRESLIAQRTFELEQYRDELEEKVNLRTKELKDAKDQAENLSRVKSEFLANMSHEIRTPLNGVLGFAEIGEMGIPAEKVQGTFKQISSSGKHLLGVINDILDFSRIEAGKFTLESQPFQISDKVNDVVGLLADQAKAKNVVLQVHYAESLPANVLGDAKRLQQILINLISNAIKFTSQGEVSLTVTQNDKLTSFKVVDTGIGMSQEAMSRIFSPFEQADTSTTRKYGGSGLGLAISYSLAELMDGQIEVDSELGVGSSFILSVPLAEMQPDAPPQQEAHLNTGSRLQNLRVLAADDVEMNRVLLQLMLEKEGASVVFAENGLEALDQIKQQGAASFDLILMDIQMPVMDGYEATRLVHDIAPALPIIALSANAFEEQRLESEAAGMLDHVTKPVVFETLITSILRHVVQA